MAREIGPTSPDDDGLLRTVIETLDRHAPGLKRQVLAAQLITPADLDREWSLTGGHIFHGELSLDQAFTMRPLLGFGGYTTPIPVVDFRLPTLQTVDIRAEKVFAIQKVKLIFDLDVFNLFNWNTELRRQYDLRRTGATGYNQVLEILQPRILRLGVRMTF